RPPPTSPAFPTRRSSDLCVLVLPDGADDPAPGTAYEQGDEHRGERHERPRDDDHPEVAMRVRDRSEAVTTLRNRVVLEEPVRESDRKSTRLNSSHEWISY